MKRDDDDPLALAYLVGLKDPDLDTDQPRPPGLTGEVLFISAMVTLAGVLAIAIVACQIAAAL